MPIPLPVLMRQNATSNIARSFGPKPPMSIGQPPVIGFTPGPQIAPEHIDPIYPPGARTGANPTNPAAMSYLALMRSAGRPVQPGFTPQGRELGQEPPLPVGGGGPGPGETTPLIPTPFPVVPGTLGPGNINPHSLPGGGPTGPIVQLPRDTDPGDIEPGILPGTDPRGSVDPRVGAQPWHDNTVNNPVGPTFGGGDHIPGSGGRVGTGTNTTPQESVAGGLIRRLPLPYGLNLIPQLTHQLLGYQRRHGPGVVGGSAHIAGRPRTSGNPAQPVQAPAHQSGSLAAILAAYPHLNTPAGIRAIEGGARPDQLAGRSQFDAHANAMQLMASTAYAGRPNQTLVNDNARIDQSMRGPQLRGRMTPEAAAAFAQMYGDRGVRTRDIYAGGG